MKWLGAASKKDPAPDKLWASTPFSPRPLSDRELCSHVGKLGLAISRGRAMVEVEEVWFTGSTIRAQLDETPEVRPFPASVTKLLNTLRDSSATSRELATVVECDPALALRLLRTANSPLYGVTSEVRSVQHAVSLLGTRSLKSLALSLAGNVMFASGGCSARERRALWSHSLGCAVVARIIAQANPMVNADDAFLAGIFHDIGKLLFYDIAPKDYSHIAGSPENQLIDEEERVFAVTHEEIGIRSANSWALAEEIKVAIGFHHRPHLSPAHSEWATTIRVANLLAKAGGIGSEWDQAVEIPDAVLGQVGIEPDQVDSILEEALRVFVEVHRACRC